MNKRAFVKTMMIALTIVCMVSVNGFSQWHETTTVWRILVTNNEVRFRTSPSNGCDWWRIVLDGSEQSRSMVAALMTAWETDRKVAFGRSGCIVTSFQIDEN